MVVSEEVEATLRELKSWGLTGTVERGGKHFLVRFETPLGKYCVTCAVSGSDVRGALNARAAVRRRIREAGITHPVPTYRKLERALSLPEPTEDLPTRVSRLEAEVGELLSLVFELQEKLALSVSSSVVAPPPAEPLLTPPTLLALTPDPVQEPPQLSPARNEPRKPTRKRKKQGDEGIDTLSKDPNSPNIADRILRTIDQNWTSRHEILRRSKEPVNSIGPTLSRLKRAGLIEAGMRGCYRRTQLGRIVGIQATTVER